MPTASDSRDLKADDLVLSHFTLSRHHDLVERVDAAAAAGCRGIGTYIGDYQRLVAEGGAAQMAGLLDDRGLCVAEIDVWRGWGRPASAQSADLADQEATAFAIAERFGCRSLHVIGPHVGSLRDAIEAFAALCDRAADHGLLVSLEFMPSTNIASAADALRIVEAADRSNGGLCVDVWHHQRGANDLELIRALPGEKVIDVQMSDGTLVPASADYGGDTRRNRVPPGDGQMDLVGFVQAIRSTGTTAPWSIEVCNEAAWATDGRDFVVRCATGLRQILAAAAEPGPPERGPTEPTRRDPQS
jgi:sugar phosphate isomerase/epimerase